MQYSVRAKNNKKYLVAFDPLILLLGRKQTEALYSRK